MAVMLSEAGRITDDQAVVCAGRRVEQTVIQAVIKVPPRFAGQTIGRPETSCSKVGDMVVEALS